MGGLSPDDKDVDLVQKATRIEQELRLAGLRAERDEVYRLGRSRRLSGEIVRKLVRKIDLIKARLTAN